MNNEDYFKKNREKVDFNNIETWKYLPYGEPLRQIYDYYHLTLEDYLKLYYKEFRNKEQWNLQWMDLIVKPAFNNDLEAVANRLGLGVKSWFSVSKMKNFYFKIKDNSIFEDDINLFISWMHAMNFFESNSISFEDWVSTKNYNIGGRHKVDEDIYSLREMASSEYGNNLVKDKLMQLEWHKR